MPRSLRHCLDAVAVIMSAAECSNTSGLKNLSESRTPLSTCSVLAHCAKVFVLGSPVCLWVSSIWRMIVGRLSTFSLSKAANTCSTWSVLVNLAPRHAFSPLEGANMPKSSASANSSRACSPASKDKLVSVSWLTRTFVLGPSGSEVNSDNTCNAS